MENINLLSSYHNQIQSAFNWISFDPEKRADGIIRDYGEELNEDLKELEGKQGNYQEKYIKYFLNWISAKSRCMSSAITGPSNFPTRKAENANRAESNHYENFRNWRDKYFTAVYRVKTLSPENDLEKAFNQLDRAIILNENLKLWNKSIRNYKKEKITLEVLTKELKENNVSDESLKLILDCLKYEYWNGLGTNSTQVKKLRDKANELKSRIETKKNWKDIFFEGGKITLANDRINIFHDTKPDQEIINNLKHSGFRWSPNWKCWTRKHTINAVLASKRICLKSVN
jgi:hypothetical protein